MELAKNRSVVGAEQRQEQQEYTKTRRGAVERVFPQVGGPQTPGESQPMRSSLKQVYGRGMPNPPSEIIFYHPPIL